MSNVDKKAKYQKRLAELIERQQQIAAKGAALDKKVAEVEALIAAAQ